MLIYVITNINADHLNRVGLPGSQCMVLSYCNNNTLWGDYLRFCKMFYLYQNLTPNYINQACNIHAYFPVQGVVSVNSRHNTADLR